jgi:hypothetical protein
VAIALLVSVPAQAQDISISFGNQGTGLTERIIQLIALLTVLSLAPSILVMMTSFTRIVVVLSLLCTALGTVDSAAQRGDRFARPVAHRLHHGPGVPGSYDAGIKPLIANEITAGQAFQRSAVPFKAFMLKNVLVGAGRIAVLGDAAHAMPPYLAQGAGHAMMNALGLAEALRREPSLASALAAWERRERPLTEHTQLWTRIYGATMFLPKPLKRFSILVERIPWVARQYLRAATHVPTGCAAGNPVTL